MTVTISATTFSGVLDPDIVGSSKAGV